MPPECSPRRPLTASPLSVLAALALTAAGCSDGSSASPSDAGARDTGASTPDSGTARPDAQLSDAASDPEACDPAIEPIAGGGIGGGRIRGALTVFARAAESGALLPGVSVVAQFGGDELVRVTREDGCVAFRDPRLGGAARVHLFAEGRVYQSLVGFDAAIATVNLQPIIPVDPEPATISGTVRGFPILTASTATIARVGYLEAIPTDVFVSALEQNRRPENNNVGANVVVAGRGGALDFRDYSLLVSPDETAGVAIRAGAIYFPRFGPPYVELSHDGFLLGLDPGPGEDLTGQDVVISHPLVERFTVTYGSTPRLPRLYALAYVVLPGASGWFFHGQSEESSGTAVFDGLPSLDGVLEGSTYGAAVQAVGETAFSLVVEPGTAEPQLDVGDLPDPPSGIRADGRTLIADARGGPDELVLFSLENRGQRLWAIAFLSSNPEPSISLPIPPGDHRDPLSGRLELSVVRALYEGVRLGALSFSELEGGRIRKLVGDTVAVEF